MIGDGAIAAYVVTKQKVDVFPVCMAFGVGAMIATLAAARISGAHVNPAATVAFALQGKIRWRLVPIYVCAQYLGGFLAALVLFINYSEAISALDGGRHSAYGPANSTGAIFATYPAEYASIWGCLMDQIIGTAVLLFALSALSDPNNLGVEQKHQPVAIALIVGFVCIAFSPNCGAIFNPARDLAPRLLTHLCGYLLPSVWSPLAGRYWLLAGVVGPHVGAVLGLFGYKLLIGDACLDLQLTSNYDVSRSLADESLSELAPSKHVSAASAKFSIQPSAKQQQQRLQPLHHQHRFESGGQHEESSNYPS